MMINEKSFEDLRVYVLVQNSKIETVTLVNLLFFTSYRHQLPAISWERFRLLTVAPFWE